jgi:endonuclease/exonuclease/phosphatase family metal-dependent hydrolase
MAELVKDEFEKIGKNYALIWGRFTPILYRPEKLELVDTQFLTYPEELCGFEGEFNDVKSKAVNVAVFRIKESGKYFIFATTHLWWKTEPSEDTYANVAENCLLGSNKARTYQIGLAIDLLESFRKKYNCPIVFVGDMNTGYDTEAIKLALDRGFRHARFLATDYADTTVGYHNCFAWGFENHYFDDPFEMAIDHILVKGEAEGAVKRFERYSPDYYFPISDHSPAFIAIEI